MDKSYISEILEGVAKEQSDPTAKEKVLKRLFHGYEIISEEISKEIATKKYRDKGIRS